MISSSLSKFMILFKFKRKEVNTQIRILPPIFNIYLTNWNNSYHLIAFYKPLLSL